MEHPHDDYHVRPYPQQPKRGGHELITALRDLESMIGSEVPDLDRLKEIQIHIHTASSFFNDDRFVDRLRMLSTLIDQFLGSPQRSSGQNLREMAIQIFSDLKHM